jgi:hypothetical protein
MVSTSDSDSGDVGSIPTRTCLLQPQLGREVPCISFFFFPPPPLESVHYVDIGCCLLQASIQRTNILGKTILSVLLPLDCPSYLPTYVALALGTVLKGTRNIRQLSIIERTQAQFYGKTFIYSWYLPWYYNQTCNSALLETSS